MPDFSTALSEPRNPTYAYVGAFVDELRRSGLRHAVICPGSRSTPLALTFASVPAIRSWMHVDERSAAFFALGLAKQLNEPVALLCTSGTATANFFPAIVEAHLTHVPLLVLTSDRPPELRDCGAPQAIDQQHLYGTHVKWFMETALPEANNEALRYIRTLACRAFAQSRALPAGPVHLNMPFREPLTPAPISDQPLLPAEKRDPVAWQGRDDDSPYTQVHASAQQLVPHDALRDLAKTIDTHPRGLILVGPQTDHTLVKPLLQLARATGYPILADPLSQLRGTHQDDRLLILSYDAFLRSEHFVAQYVPQLVLRFGAMPTSKPVLLYLKRHASNCQQVIIDPHHGWEEPTQFAAQFFYTEIANFCSQLSELLGPSPRYAQETSGAPLPSNSGHSNTQREITDQTSTFNAFVYPDNAKEWSVTPRQQTQEERVVWARAWQETDQVTRQALSRAITDLPDLFEGRVFTELAELLPAGTLFYVGNSMPVRDMDTFFWPRMHDLRCLGNRGANGIDGVVSSALGASAATIPGGRTVLVIGDLSFFHDLNGLLAAHLHALNLVIVLIHNDGGGIFSFLPQAAYPEHFERLFGTPTGLHFRPVVEMYGGTFEHITSWDYFENALQTGLAEGRLHVLEIPTERESNVMMHRQLWQVVDRALQQAGMLMKDEK